MGITMVLSLLSGVALFLYGMALMGDSLKKVAGNKLELILYKLTNSPIKGLLLGTVVTAIIQSSSATTVMVVGFVNSGMMKVAQAIGIIMGANIGTSITGWILCLSYIDGSSGIAQLLSTATISAIVAIIGIIFRTFVKKKPYSDIGDIMLGFAILMFGMQTMSGAVSPLKENPHFVSLLTMFKNPFMGILVGIAFTAVLQSASASVGILQALSITGSITFAAALPITMGIGVGAACPVLLSSIGTNKNGKRTALIYLLNDLFGMIFWSIVFYSVNAAVHFTFMDRIMSPVNIALLNSVFRIATILILAPFISKIEKLVFFLIKDTDEDNEEQADFDLLEERFLDYPPLAISQSQMAVNGMAKNARKNLMRAFELLTDFSDSKFNKIQEKENMIDKYEDKLGTYLMQLSDEERTFKYERFISSKIPCVIFSTMTRPSQDMIDLAYKYNVPTFVTERTTSSLMAEIIRWLGVQLAPCISIHGVLVDVYGEGVLITGESGIGKSEAALELIKRGHRLVSDDVVELRKVSDVTLVGSAPDITRHFIELRGIGIIDVKTLFGVESVKDTQSVDLVIKLEEWDRDKEYDRLGLHEEYTEYLGNKIVCHSLPIRPGRNLAVIVESAAVNHRQKKMGYNAAEELYKRVQANIAKKREE